jgi:hypothetical protein
VVVSIVLLTVATQSDFYWHFIAFYGSFFLFLPTQADQHSPHAVLKKDCEGTYFPGICKRVS